MREVLGLSAYRITFVQYLVSLLQLEGLNVALAHMSSYHLLPNYPLLGHSLKRFSNLKMYPLRALPVPLLI